MSLLPPSFNLALLKNAHSPFPFLLFLSRNVPLCLSFAHLPKSNFEGFTEFSTFQSVIFVDWLVGWMPAMLVLHLLYTVHVYVRVRMRMRERVYVFFLLHTLPPFAHHSNGKTLIILPRKLIHFRCFY